MQNPSSRNLKIPVLPAPPPKKLKKQKTVTLCIHLHKLNPAKKKETEKGKKEKKRENSLEIQRLVSTSPHEDKMMQHKTMISLSLYLVMSNCERSETKDITRPERERERERDTHKHTKWGDKRIKPWIEGTKVFFHPSISPRSNTTQVMKRFTYHLVFHHAHLL